MENAVPAKIRRRYQWLVLLNLVLVGIALFLAYAHYRPAVTDFCQLGESWDCDVVNKSIYSELFGIPVAVLGFFTYLMFLIFSLRGMKVQQNRWVPYALAVLCGAVSFALYLTGIETFVLRTYCIFCVTQQILVLIELGVMISLYRLTRKP